MAGGFRRKRAREQSRVRVDVNGLMRGVVGDAGLADEELAAFGPRFDALAVGLERRLGFPVLPGKAELKRTVQLADAARGKFDDLVVLTNRQLARGIHALLDGVPDGGGDRPSLRIHVLDGIDPERLTTLVGRLDLRRTLFDVVSATGDALDTMSQFLIVRDRLLKELGAVEYKQHVTITTSGGPGALRQIVNDEGFRDLAFPPDVADDVAVLTAAALFPAACAGADLAALAAGAADMAERCNAGDVAANPARLLAIALARAAGACTVVAPVRLQGLGAWIERPGERLPAVPLVLFLAVDEAADGGEIPKTFQDLESIGYLGGQPLGVLAELERQARELALWSIGRPTATLVCPQIDEYVVGQVVWLVQAAVAAARGLAETPPDVAAASVAERFAWGLAGRAGFESERAEAQRRAGRKEARHVL